MIAALPCALVAVTADLRPDEDGDPWHATPQTYLTAVTRGLGAMPVLVPALGEAIDPDALLARVDGLLVTGNRSNVHPRHYGEAPSPASAPYDEARDATTLPLIRAAIRRGLPMLCICRGIQELNVALGGTLFPEVRKVEGRDDHRAPEADHDDLRYANRQELRLVPGGCFARILGDGPLQVNSLHHQAIGRLADGLAVEALAADGTIEAVSVRDAPGFALGVQWHPEYWVQTDPVSARLFHAFGDAIRARMAAEAGPG